MFLYCIREWYEVFWCADINVGITLYVQKRQKLEHIICIPIFQNLKSLWKVIKKVFSPKCIHKQLYTYSKNKNIWTPCGTLSISYPVFIFFAVAISLYSLFNFSTNFKIFPPPVPFFASLGIIHFSGNLSADCMNNISFQTYASSYAFGLQFSP